MRTAALAGVPQAVLKITGYGKGATAHVKAHLDYITRNDVKHREKGESPIDVENELGQRRGGPDSPTQTVADWGQSVSPERPSPKARQERLTMHLAISAPPGTDETKFAEIARVFGERAFAGRRYVYAIHNDQAHPRAHFVVPLRGDDGRKLNPRKADLTRWREQYAEVATELGVPMTATRWYEHRRDKPQRDQSHGVTHRMAQRGKPSELLKNDVRQAFGIPTPPMIAAAERIAKRKGIELPKDYQTKLGATRAFLEEHGKRRPRTRLDESRQEHRTQAAAYAKAGKDQLARLHEKASQEPRRSRVAALGEELHASQSVLRPPTKAMLTLAAAVAEVKGIEMPTAARTDFSAARNFLNEHVKQERSPKSGRAKGPSEQEPEP